MNFVILFFINSFQLVSQRKVISHQLVNPFYSLFMGNIDFTVSMICFSYWKDLQYIIKQLQNSTQILSAFNYSCFISRKSFSIFLMKSIYLFFVSVCICRNYINIENEMRIKKRKSNISIFLYRTDAMIKKYCTQLVS